MKRLFTLFSLMAVFAINMVFAQEQKEEKPLLTIGCLSDLHSQQTLISGPVDEIRLRGTVVNTLDSMKVQEKLDLIILGGDYLSDVTIPFENWVRMHELLKEAARNAFPEGAKTPVIYMNGNHDYEVANFDDVPKNYNAGDYYNDPMKFDIGELAAEDCFYEIAENGSSSAQKLLAAYHYVVKGFDFVVLNTGKNFFQGAWNYEFSEESVEWVEQKLAQIYADDKDKTVFFLVHLPFSDSNSISNANKGMQGNSATMLKYVLAQYPNVIMLYGHDHGTDKAYIRSKTSQRVTVYDNFGNVIPNEDAEEEEEPVGMQFYVKNAATGEYLSYDAASNMTMSATEVVGTVKPSSLSEGTFSIEYSSSAGVRFLHCGSSGRFSGNSAISGNSSLLFYKVDDPTAQSGTAKRVTEVEAGASYLFVALSSKGGYYMATNEPYGSGADLRMVGVKVSDELPGDEITFTQSATASPVWSLVAPEVVEVPEVNTYSIKNVATNQYLTYDVASNMTTTATEVFGTMDASSIVEGTFFISYPCEDAVRYLHCGSSGRFSGNATLKETSSLYVYKVADATAASGTAKRVTEIQSGASYIFVALSSKGGYYMVTNEPYGEGADLRMVGVKVSDDVPGDEITFTQTAEVSPVWTIKQEGAEETPAVSSFALKNGAGSIYLAYDVASNMTATRTKTFVEIEASTFVEGTFVIKAQGGSDIYYLHCGSNGRFSGNLTATKNASIYLYKVADATAETGTAKRVTEYEADGSYLLVAESSKGGYYMLTNELYASGPSQRMVGVKVSDEVPGDEITFTQSGNYSPVWTFTVDTGESAVYYVQNYHNSKYLGFNAYNMATTKFPTSEITVAPSEKKAGALTIHVSNPTTNNPYLYCGSNGRFSGNSDPTNVSSTILAFEVEDPEAAVINATQVSQITADKVYLLVGIKSGAYYALSNEMYRENTANQRMNGEEVTITDGKISYTPGSASVLWKFIEKSEKPGTKSFFSAFMGSMRYYNNSIETGGSTVNNSRIVQAMMIYIYKDRIELKMKNYGESGTINGVTVNKDLEPYIVNREVKHSAEAVTATPAFVDETGGDVNLGSTVSIKVAAPEWHNIYFTTDGSAPTEASAIAKDSVIEWTPTEEGEYIITVAAQEGIRLMSESITTLKYNVKAPTGIEEVQSANATVIAANNAIVVKNYTGNVKVYNTVGQLVKSTNVASNGSFPMKKGIYIVELDSKAFKVAVK